jgi:hypothetical protein
VREVQGVGDKWDEVSPKPLEWWELFGGTLRAFSFPQHGGSAANAAQRRAAMGEGFFFLLPPSTLRFAVGDGFPHSGGSVHTTLQAPGGHKKAPANWARGFSSVRWERPPTSAPRS